MIRIWLMVLSLAYATLLSAAERPDASRVSRMIEALRSCALDDARDLLTAHSVRYLELQGQYARHVEIEQSQESIDTSRFLRRLRSRPGNPDLEAIYADYCGVFLAERSRLLLHGFAAGRSFEAQDLSWVPLLDERRRYFGTGLTLVFEDQSWRISLLRWEELNLIYPLRQGPQFLRAWASATGSYAEEYEEEPVCPALPPAPEPSPELAEQIEAESSDISEEVLPGPRNLVSVLERQAMAFYSSGLEAAPSAVAQALQAEVLMRSAFFKSAPPVGSDAWLAQIDQAFDLMLAADATGLSMSRLGEALSWLGELYLAPEFARPADLSKARHAFEIAARNQSVTGAVWLAKVLGFSLDGAPAQCARALDLLASHRQDQQVDALMASAWIELECADPSSRDLALAQQWTAALHQIRLYDASEQDELLRLDASLACALSAESSDWRSSCPPQPDHDGLEFQAARKLAQLFRPNNVSIPEQFLGAPPPSYVGELRGGERPLRCD